MRICSLIVRAISRLDIPPNTDRTASRSSRGYDSQGTRTSRDIGTRIIHPQFGRLDPVRAARRRGRPGSRTARLHGKQGNSETGQADSSAPRATRTPGKPGDRPGAALDISLSSPRISRSGGSAAARRQRWAWPGPPGARRVTCQRPPRSRWRSRHAVDARGQRHPGVAAAGSRGEVPCSIAFTARWAATL